MHWIDDGFALGSLEDVMNQRRLEQAGIRSVLTVNGFPNRSWSRFECRAVPLIDGPGNPPEAIAAAVAHLDELHQEHAPVLIVSLHLARRRGISLEDAYARVKACREIVDIDDALWEMGTRLFDGVVQAVAAGAS